MAAKQHAILQVPGLKVAVPLKPDTLPQDLVPRDGPAGEPILELHLEGSPLALRARLNGKNYRKLLKQVAEHGPDQVVVVLQGTLKAGTPAGPLTLDSAGFQCTPKKVPAPEVPQSQ